MGRSPVFLRGLRNAASFFLATHLASQCCSAVRVTHESDSASPLWNDGALKVKLWTWNSGVKDLSKEAQLLSSSPANVLVTCQTEATKAIKDFISDDWLLVAHGQHWGMTGITDFNAQVLSIFVRKSLEGDSNLRADVAEVEGAAYKPHQAGTIYGKRGQLIYEVGGVKRRMLQSRAIVHATDLKGKGGVSASLSFDATQKRAASKLAFICAHLDSESDSVRTEGVQQMLTELRASTGGVQDALDAEVIFGDLNYRLLAKGIEHFDPAMLLSAEMRLKLAENDPLVPGPKGKNPNFVVLPLEQGGAGFQCNSPFAAYLPTYKRMGGEPCAELGKRVAACGGRDQDDCKQDVVDLVNQCYKKKGKQEEQWSSKDTSLQLGWLDRFCFRSDGASTISLSVGEDEGWETTPGVKDKKAGSDHMPVAATLSVANPQCPCPALPAEAYLGSCSPGRTLKLNEEDELRCSNGFQLVEKNSRQKLEVAMVQCGQNGEIAVPWGANKEGLKLLSQFQCLRICGRYDGLNQSDFGVQSPQDRTGFLETLAVSAPVASSLNAVSGDTVEMSCQDGSALIGSQELTCSENGLFTPAPNGGYVAASNGERMPMCLGYCELGKDLRQDLWVQERTVAGPELLKSPYGPEIDKEFGNAPAKSEIINRVFVGGNLSLGCRRKCTPLRRAVLSCEEFGQFTPPAESLKCACSVGIRVRSMAFSNKRLQGEAKYMKLQVFKGPFGSSKLLQEARKHKRYIAAEAFSVGKVGGPGGALLHVSEGLADAVVHLTVCSKRIGPTKRPRRYCSIAAETDINEGLLISDLLQHTQGPDFVGSMAFTMNWSGIPTKVKFQIALTPE